VKKKAKAIRKGGLFAFGGSLGGIYPQ